MRFRTSTSIITKIGTNARLLKIEKETGKPLEQ